jgi:hypothetical protein
MSSARMTRGSATPQQMPSVAKPKTAAALRPASSKENCLFARAFGNSSGALQDFQHLCRCNNLGFSMAFQPQ